MKRSTKLGLGGAALILGTVILSSCTASFCSVKDKSHMLFVFDYGVTAYYDGADANKPEDAVKLDGYNNVYATYKYENCAPLNSIILSAKKDGLRVPTVNYFKKMDELVLQDAIEAKQAALGDTAYPISEITASDITDQKEGLLATYGYLKFYDKEAEGHKTTLWGNYEELNNEIRKSSDVSVSDCPDNDFITFYKQRMMNSIAAYRSCLATVDGKYGYYGKGGGTYTGPIDIEGKSWGFAWSKGFLEGLLIYPMGWFIDTVTVGMIKGGVAAGVAQILSILILTIIVRGLMLAVTFKQTAANTKMTELQPQIAKIQAKYPNANTNQNEKMRMAEEMQKLYKKNKINPFSAIVVMIFQFPIFICVWGALQGSAMLGTGQFLGLDLSQSISNAMFNGANWGAGGHFAAWTALVLFILMSAAQVVSMLLPQWLQKAKAKKFQKLGRNPAKKAQDNKMKWFTYIMMVMIIIMGFSLASGLGVYWFIGALMSIVQTVIMNAVANRKTSKERR